MGNWIRASLGRKFAFALTAGLLSASLLFLVLFLGLYRAQLEGERARTSEQMNRLLQAALENAMLKRDLDGLATIVDRLGQQDGVAGVMIANPLGEIRFASDPNLLGQVLDTSDDWAAGRTLFLVDDKGREVLRSVNPVRNKEPCQQCHGPMAEHPVNGILFVDYDAATLRATARDTALVLITSGGAVVIVMIAAVWGLLSKLVLSRLAQFHSSSRAFAAGNLDTAVPVDGEDEIALLAGTFNDMVATIRARIRDIREKETFLQALIDAIPDGITVVGDDWKLAKVNRAYRRQQRYGEGESLVGRSCHQATHGLDEPCPASLVTCPLDVIAREGQPVKTVHTHRRTDGTTAEYEVYAAPMELEIEGVKRRFVVESIRDLAADIRFSHEQKLSSVGQLAAGVAHEIRNPLASIRLALQGMLRELEARGGEDHLCDYLRLVDGQIDKCIDVNNRLLKLSAGSGDKQRQLVEVNTAVAETLSLLSWHADELGIEVTTELDPSGPRVLSTDGDMRMLIVNLVQNAFHAMPGGGRLLVAVRQSGQRVLMRFDDTGCGIKPEHKRRIFEPFFTNRANGEGGTGLGLAICKSIVDSMGGAIAVESQQGIGSCFVIDLPDAEAAIDLEEAR